MGAKKIFCFPRFTVRLREKIIVESTGLEFGFYDRGEYHVLNLEPLEGYDETYRKLVDEQGIWTNDTHDLFVSSRIDMSSLNHLFGVDGIVPQDAEIGVAVLYKSNDSKQRNAVSVGTFIAGDRNKSFSFTKRFQRGKFRGDVKFEIIFYVAREGNALPEEEHLANKMGYRLGEVDDLHIVLDGKGSWFPIYEQYSPNQPLWDVKYSVADPAYEPFVEAVGIYINTAHKNYKYLNKRAKEFNPQLLIEVIASAMCMVIMKFKEQEAEWSKAMEGVDFEEGSVSQAINYFVRSLEWDASSYENLSRSIRNYLEREI